jgi:hypothetical protein
LIHIRTHCHVDPPLQKGPGVQDGAGQNVQKFGDAIAEPLQQSSAKTHHIASIFSD